MDLATLPLFVRAGAILPLDPPRQNTAEPTEEPTTVRIYSGADGVFRFTNNPSHKIQVSAEKPGVGRSQRVPVFLYFRSQDTTLDSPLRLTGSS